MKTFKNFINIACVCWLSSAIILVSGCSLFGFLGGEKSNAEKNQEANARSDKKRHRRQRDIHTRPAPENPNNAIDLMRRRKFKEALKILDNSLEKTPNSAEIHSLRGDCLFQLMEFDEALKAYKLSRKLDQTYYPALLGKGLVKLNIAKKMEDEGEVQKAYSNYSESIDTLREANRILPGNMNASYGRAHAAAGIGNFFYQRALNLQRIRNDLQGAETMKDKALEFYKEALEFAIPYSAQFLRNIEARAFVASLHKRVAILFNEFKQIDMARSSLTSSIMTWESILKEIDPKNTQAKEEIKICKKMLASWESKLNTDSGTKVEPFMNK